jgi:hypothetical protein
MFQPENHTRAQLHFRVSTLSLRSDEKNLQKNRISFACCKSAFSRYYLRQREREKCDDGDDEDDDDFIFFFFIIFVSDGITREEDEDFDAKKATENEVPKAVQLCE